jgi:hypothetical protein
MPGSYKDVDYTLRPAKSVERKMLCEAFRRLSHFAPPATYQYIGFPSPFYSDFLLFHRALGFRRMIAIESEVRDKVRFRFNRPFRSIRCIFETSTEALPKLRWSRPSVVWLDYDTAFYDGVFADIATVCSSARSGTMLAITLDAKLRGDKNDTGRAVEKFDRLRADFGTRLPRDLVLNRKRRPVDAAFVAEGGLPRIYSRIALDAMIETTRQRSAALPDDRKMRFQQLFDFEYKDSAEMVTVGGLLYEQRDEAKAAACQFENLPFIVHAGRPPHALKVPRLTHREARYLDRQIPMKDGASFRRTGLSAHMVREYERIYRWFPTFAETEL